MVLGRLGRPQLSALLQEMLVTMGHFGGGVSGGFPGVRSPCAASRRAVYDILRQDVLNLRASAQQAHIASYTHQKHARPWSRPTCNLKGSHAYIQYPAAPVIGFAIATGGDGMSYSDGGDDALGGEDIGCVSLFQLSRTAASGELEALAREAEQAAISTQVWFSASADPRLAAHPT